MNHWKRWTVLSVLACPLLLMPLLTTPPANWTLPGEVWSSPVSAQEVTAAATEQTEETPNEQKPQQDRKAEKAEQKEKKERKEKAEKTEKSGKRESDEEDADEAEEAEPGAPYAAQGIMVGEVTDSSAIIQVRLTRTPGAVDGEVPGMPGRVRFVLSSFSLEVQPLQQSVKINWERDADIGPAQEEFDFIARVKFTGLKPNQTYRCRTRLESADGKKSRGPTAEFRTLAGPEIATNTKFVVVTGMNYAKFHGDERIDRKQHLEQNNIELPEPYQGEDKHLGYPALKTILDLEPHFFVGTGDNVYYDTPTKGRAETIEEMRRKWQEQFVQPRYLDLFAKVPTYWEIDDHDYRMDDSDNSGDYLPSPETAVKVMLEQLPYARHSERNPQTYRTHRVSQDLQIWLTENRRHRSDNDSEDGPEKTIWGEEQRDWLKRTLLESNAKFKLIISPTPMVGPDDKRKNDNHTNIGGFQHERDEFFAWMKELKLDRKHVYIICGDRHWQYHAIHPLGIEEFSCGALVTANSRIGRSPGDPDSTDPEGLIRQPYSQKEPSGGFLEVEVEPARLLRSSRLHFRFRDEAGEILYQHTKN